MNRLEMEKEIEDNIKGIGYKNEDNTLNEEGKILKDIYLRELNLGNEFDFPKPKNLIDILLKLSTSPNQENIILDFYFFILQFFL